jgi:hypothetical protein
MTFLGRKLLILRGRIFKRPLQLSKKSQSLSLSLKHVFCFKDLCRPKRGSENWDYPAARLTNFLLLFVGLINLEDRNVFIL